MKIANWILCLPLFLTIIFAGLIYLKMKDVEKRALKARERQNEYRRQLELKQQMVVEDPEKPDE